MSTDSSNPILRRLGVAGVGDERHFIFYAQRAEHDEVSLDEPVEVQRATRGRQTEEIWIILTLKRLRRRC